MVVPALPLSVAVNANQLNAVEEVCGQALGCTQSGVIGQLLLLVAFGLITVFVLAAIHRVSEARSTLKEERSRTATERDAFERFAKRVDSVDASSSGYQLAATEGVVSAAAVTGQAPTDGRLDAVRDAYRETVMSMGHYEEEYDEPLAEHLRAEFGQEVATAVADGDQLTAELKQVLIDRAHDAARDRERLMHRLEREADDLEAAERELTAVAEAVEDAEARPIKRLGYRRLADEWNRLGELESRLSRLLNRRQDSLRSRRASTDTDEVRTLSQYLYADLDTAFPVLTDGAILADRVKGARSRVLTALTNRA